MVHPLVRVLLAIVRKLMTGYDRDIGDVAERGCSAETPTRRCHNEVYQKDAERGMYNVGRRRGASNPARAEIVPISRLVRATSALNAPFLYK